MWGGWGVVVRDFALEASMVVLHFWVVLLRAHICNDKSKV